MKQWGKGNKGGGVGERNEAILLSNPMYNIKERNIKVSSVARFDPGSYREL